MITMCNRRRPGRGFAFILITLAPFLTASAAQAAVWYVNAASTAPTPDGKSWATAYPTIQPAVNACFSGDEVWVATGTYTGTGTQVVSLKTGMTLYGGFSGKETVLGQRDWKGNPTIIDGGKVRRCVTSSVAVVDGFVLQNGKSLYGAGMSYGTARNCTFHANQSYTTSSTGIWGGGGLYQGTAINCVFIENTAGGGKGGGNGGGVCQGTVVSCTFLGNSANCGGAIYSSTATNCVFVRNRDTSYGGATYGGRATNCTYVKNVSFSGGGMGYGTAVNCIFYGNAPNETMVSTVLFSCFPEQTAGTGNIAGDPGFISAVKDDFRLRSNSSCVNAGDASGAPVKDLLGRARPQGAGVDMGAYEYYPGDDTGAGFPPTALLVNAASTAAEPDGLTWETAYSTLQAAADRAGFGTEIWVAQGVYTATEGNQVVDLWPGTRMYGGFDGTETTRDTRNVDASSTVIDGQGVRRCVTASATALVDGFTLRNGSAGNGGGMCFGTAVHCVFNKNKASSNGGGMYYGTATNCIYSENAAYSGGGMDHGTATNCVFNANAARYYGGGMYYGMGTNCIFSGNTANSGGGSDHGVINNCTFYGNSATSSGGGMSAGVGVNCIVWGNLPEEVSGTDVSYSCMSVLAPGIGNIAAAPVFVNFAAGDFRLSGQSPCIDAGTAKGAPATDFLNRPRPQGAGIDMGAYEYHSGDDANAVLPRVLRVDATSTAIQPDGLTWNTAFSDVQSGVDAAVPGDEIWVASGTYTGTGGQVVNISGLVTLYGGFAGSETARDQRDWKRNVTIIDGQDTRRCVTAARSSVVEGFTIKQGKSDSGAGMYFGTAKDCVFTANSATSTSSASGGGASHCTVVDCTFVANTAKSLGGGMYYGTATNCLFSGNVAESGGGMAECTAVNCTIAGNSGPGVHIVTATNCIIWGNSRSDVFVSTISFSCLPDAVPGTGNITMDPGFVNPWAGDFRLRADSPCVDAGTAEGVPATDLLGRARPQGAGIDMGAYEYHPGDDANAVFPPAVLRVNAVSTAGTPDGLTWETAYPTLQAAADRAGYGTELWVAQGTYTPRGGGEVVLLGPGVSLFGGFTGTETTRDARSLGSASTKISGDYHSRCVTARTGALVDGVTLCNGSATLGGGMSGGTAVNCIISGNLAVSKSVWMGSVWHDTGGAGGGMYLGSAINCVFSENIADLEGGGAHGCSATNCTFTGNTVRKGGGGGMSYGTAINCAFSENSARAGYYGGGDGGGMRGGIARNCIFLNNSAALDGGGMYSGKAENCTFFDNTAETDGGGMYGATATNCILWQNTPVEVSSTTTVSHSCLSLALAGAGNIAADPLFVDAAAGDFRLQSGSPCIDTGTDAGAPATDILGVPRPQGAGIDMGAHEAVVPVTMPDLTGLARFAARELILASRLYVGRETEEYHLTVPADHITRHTPVAGVQTPQWTKVDLVVSKGSIPVPDVVGKTQDGAAQIIADAGMVVGQTAQEYSLAVPAGTVIGQTPAPGTAGVPGMAVDLLVSRGGITVPDVVGQAQYAASSIITDAELSIGTVTQQYSLTVAVGMVISQSVAPGTPALPGSPIDLLVSRGGIAVPDVAGQTQRAASEVITGAQLVVGTVSEQYSLTVPAGGVISQSVAPGTPALPGTAIDLVVSRGGITVPDVVGQVRHAAYSAVTGAGLVVGIVSQQYSAAVPAGTVVSQTPGAGTPVLPGAPVDLVLSRGVQPSVMPDVVGQSRTQAGAAIGGAGLALGLVARAHSTEVVTGSVVSQSPAGGTELPPGTVVSIVVSLGPVTAVEGEGEPLDTGTALEQLSAAYESADTNGDGTLSFGESSAAAPGLTRAVFDELDTNRDGQLEGAELGIDDASGCAGCRGGRGKGLTDLFLLGFGFMGLAATLAQWRPQSRP